MKDTEEEKWTVGTAVGAVFVGVCVIVAAPVIALAYAMTKAGEALGIDNTPREDVNPYDL